MNEPLYLGHPWPGQWRKITRRQFEKFGVPIRMPPLGPSLPISADHRHIDQSQLRFCSSIHFLVLKVARKRPSYR